MPKLKPGESLIGAQLGDYVLTRMLATGGMAKVYEGVDNKLRRHAAVKVLDDDKLSSDITLTERFQREARAIAQLDHPNIIPIYQYGEQDGVYFLAMKLIRGNDLAHELSHLRHAGERMDVKITLHILEQIAAALDIAHAANIIHRDIKPSNILLDQMHHAILTDFGLVFQPSIDTTSGTSFGTPRYIAPEQAMSSGGALPQSDLYSLGVIAYQMLVGQTPFAGDSPLELALAHISKPPPPPRSINPGMPEAAERELLKVLAKDPADRHATAGEFVSALKHAYEAEDARNHAPALIESPAIIDEDEGDLPPTGIMPAPPPQPRQQQPVSRASRAPLWVGIALLAAAAVLLIVVNGGSAGQQAAAETADPLLMAGDQTPEATPEALTMRLVYAESMFAIVNETDRDLNTGTLRFVRDAEQYDGANIVRQIVPAGSCFRLQLQGRQSELPTGCRRLHAETLLPDPLRFFWRSLPESASSFEVYYDDQLLATCPTIARGSEGDCLLTLPPPTAG